MWCGSGYLWGYCPLCIFITYAYFECVFTIACYKSGIHTALLFASWLQGTNLDLNNFLTHFFFFFHMSGDSETWEHYTDATVGHTPQEVKILYNKYYYYPQTWHRRRRQRRHRSDRLHESRTARCSSPGVREFEPGNGHELVLPLSPPHHQRDVISTNLSLPLGKVGGDSVSWGVRPNCHVFQ